MKLVIMTKSAVFVEEDKDKRMFFGEKWAVAMSRRVVIPRFICTLFRFIHHQVVLGKSAYCRIFELLRDAIYLQ